MAEGSILPLFMGNDGSGPYHVSGQPGHGPLPVTFGAPPTGLDVNSTTQFKGSDGLTYDVKAATVGDGPLPVILANALGPLNTDSLTQFHGTDGLIYTVKGPIGDGPLPVQLAAGGAAAPVHIDPTQLPLPVHLDPTQLPIPVHLDPTQLPIPVLLAAGGAAALVSGVSANGAAPTGNPVLGGGWDGANTRTLLTDTSGALLTVSRSNVATYSTTFSFNVTGAGGPIIQLQGAAGKKIKILRLRFSGQATAAATDIIWLSKTSTGITGGVTLPLASLKFDTNDPNSASTLTAYTTIGVGGTGLANYGWTSLQLGVFGTSVGQIYEYTPPSGGQTIVLNNAAEYFCVIMSTAPAGSYVNGFLEWTEE